MLTRCLGCMEEYDPALGVCPHCGFVPGTPAEEAIHMDPGTVLHGRYLIGRVLGYGGFGVTYIGWDSKLEQKVAIKEYLPGEFSTRMPGRSQVSVFSGDKAEQFADGMHKFVEEARRLAMFQKEPGIVTVFDSFEENNTAYIVMEYLDGETLTDYLKREGRIQEDEAVAMLMPLMESLEKVHVQGILHRDIAPDNIFLTKDGQVKLIDFGAARYATTSHSRSLTVIIKPGYSPEEQYRSRGDQGPHTDVYALGATLYKMITGVTPPDAMERRAKYESQSKDILVPPQKNAKGLSVTRRNAILNAMNVRIEDRTPDVETLIKELNADKPAKLITGKIKKIDVYAWPLWLKIILPVLGVAVLTFGTLLAAGVIRIGDRYSKRIVMPSRTVRVPDVEGLSSEEAIKAIEEGKLIVATGGNVQSEYAPAGYIVLQEPAAGSYAPVNSQVKVIVSAGTGIVPPFNGTATVPYIVWGTLDEARAKLAEAGLGEPEIEEVYNDNVSEGMVVSLDRDVGDTVPVGTVLKLNVSKGPKPFELQSVVGMSEEEARTVLEGKGVLVNAFGISDNDIEKGRVIKQFTPEGTLVRKGDMVEILVSTGPEVIESFSISVEHHIGKANSKWIVYDTEIKRIGITDEASRENGIPVVDILAKFCYVSQVKFITIVCEDGWTEKMKAEDLSKVTLFIKDSELMADSIEDPRFANIGVTRIDVEYSDISDETTLPNVLGMSEKEAKEALKKAGFMESRIIVDEERIYSDTYPEGAVARVYTFAGDVKSGDKINNTTDIYLSVSRGATFFVDPTLYLGRSDIDSAVNTLQLMGLVVKTVPEPNSSFPSGQIIWLTLEPDSRDVTADHVFKKGDTIYLHFAKPTS